MDVTLSCEGQFLKAHRLVLSAGSKYLERILQCDGTRCPTIHFYGVEMFILKLLVEFMYTGEVEVPSADLEKFIRVAENLEVKGLKGDGKMQGPGTTMPSDAIEAAVVHKRRIIRETYEDHIYPRKLLKRSIDPHSKENQRDTQVSSHTHKKITCHYSA